MKLLAIETSCDETAAAVVQDGREILSSVVYSQCAEHALYGGVVPEIASRRHAEQIVPVVSQALQQAGLTPAELDALGVTAAPGLIGAVLVGVNFAKGLAMAWDKPLVPVHHLRGHVASNYLAHHELQPPFLCLIASGGHSHVVEVADYTTFKVLGRSCDDAAGEAYDKVARAMGLGYPGGQVLDTLAQTGNPQAYPLPEPKVRGSLCDFSFSGLKTAVVNILHNAEQRGEAVDAPGLAASFQERVCGLLCEGLFTAAKHTGQRKLVLAGGVAANSRLRTMATQKAAEYGCQLYLPPVVLCGDNAAMVASQAYYEYIAGHTAGLALNGQATMEIAQAF